MIAATSILNRFVFMEQSFSQQKKLSLTCGKKGRFPGGNKTKSNKRRKKKKKVSRLSAHYGYDSFSWLQNSTIPYTLSTSCNLLSICCQHGGCCYENLADIFRLLLLSFLFLYSEKSGVSVLSGDMSNKLSSKPSKKDRPRSTGKLSLCWRA